MDKTSPLWVTDAAGTLSAVFGVHLVTVKQLPKARARFVVWSKDTRHALTSGTFASTNEAIKVAEQSVARLASAAYRRSPAETVEATQPLN